MSGENLRKHKKNRRYIFSAQNRLHLRYKNQTGRYPRFLFLFSFFSRPRLFPLSVARLLLLFSRSIIHLLHGQLPPLPLHALSSLSQPSVSQPLNRSLHLPRPEPQLAKTKKKPNQPYPENQRPPDRPTSSPSFSSPDLPLSVPICLPFLCPHRTSIAPPSTPILFTTNRGNATLQTPAGPSPSSFQP